MRFSLVLASLALASCSSTSGDSQGNSPPPAAPAWQVVFDEAKLDRVAVSVWGASPDDVLVVGGALGNGGAPLALRFDGTTWTDLKPSGVDSFWWVHGTGPNDVWMVGEHGRVAHFDGTALVDVTTLGTTTLWGVYAAAPDDVFAVGGTPGAGTGAPNDLIFHFDGSSWTQVSLPGVERGASFYKVWGTSPENVWVVGEGGTIWHETQGTWTLEAEGVATGTLFTVNGCSDHEVYAVGDFDVLFFDGGNWTRLDAPKLTGRAFGVSCGPSGQAIVVGSGGQKDRLANGTWTSDFSSVPHTDLHGAWADGKGDFWVVGGDFSSGPAPGQRRPGVVARWGAGLVATSLAP